MNSTVTPVLALVIVAGAGCSSVGEADHGNERGRVPSRQDDDELSAWERERRDQQDRLIDDRRRYSTGERR